MTPEKIEKYRADFIANLEEHIWKKECNAAYDESRIPLVIAERTKALDEVVALTKEFKDIDSKFDPKDHSKTTRTAKKKWIDEMELKIKKANDVADDCEDTIASINNSVRNARQEASNFKSRIEFAKTYGNENTKNQ